jgi:hypothetical protein
MLTAVRAGTLVSELAERAGQAGLHVVAGAAWPESDEDTLAPLAGFVGSTFSPLVAEVAQRCLHRAFGEPPLDAARGERTAIIVMSRHGDIGCAATVARAVAGGERVGPLLFFQSVPHAVAGHIAARWGLAGPMACLSTETAGLDVAALLLEGDEADAALVVRADQGSAGVTDRAAALVVARPAVVIPSQLDGAT